MINTMVEKLSYQSLAIHVKYLRIAGLCELDEKSPKLVKSIHRIYMRGVVSFYGLYIFTQILKIYEAREDVDKVVATMFFLLTNTGCVYKCIVFRTKPKKIGEVLNVLKGTIFNQGEPEHRSVLLDTVQKALLSFYVFNTMSLVTCFLWVLPQTMYHMQGKHIEFPVWLPFDANGNPHYYFAVLYVWFQTSWLAFGNTTLDIFITFLLEQCRTQVSILRLDLENVVEKSKNEAKIASKSYSDILEDRMKKIILHHKEIVRTTDKIQDIFAWVIFYQFFVSGWILCTSAYRIVAANPASIEFVSMIIYILCILIEAFLYCFFGNKLTYESEMLMESAYAMDWLEMPVKHRKLLIIFMERVKWPIRPMAGSIIPLSNSTYISILRSSYSFFTFLKNSER